MNEHKIPADQITLKTFHFCPLNYHVWHRGLIDFEMNANYIWKQSKINKSLNSYDFCIIVFIYLHIELLPTTYIHTFVANNV